MLFGGHFEPFWAPSGFFGGGVGVRKLFWALCIYTNKFCFLSIALVLFFHVVLSLWWWGGGVVVVVFGDYRVSPNFLLCWGWVVVEVGLGCDNNSLPVEETPI